MTSVEVASGSATCSGGREEVQLAATMRVMEASTRIRRIGDDCLDSMADLDVGWAQESPGAGAPGDLSRTADDSAGITWTWPGRQSSCYRRRDSRTSCRR